LIEKNEEAELLRAAQQGNSESQDALYATYFKGNKQIQGLLEREVPLAEDREDILHDAYLSLVKSKSDFRGDSKLQTFVYRVVQIAILQKLRFDRSRRRDKMVRLVIESEGEEREREIPVQDYQFETVNADLAAEKLYAFLPETLRTPFRLRVSGDMSYDEIARQTNTPINTVATRIFKARALLAELFGAPGHGKSGKKSTPRGNQ
jgi:RNA polymerase sigma-70 factor (ECF subfamily)